VAGDQVRYEVKMNGSIRNTLCTVSAEGVTTGYIRASATPAGVPECSCGTTEATAPCQ
jgi:hypothetical protein